MGYYSAIKINEIVPFAATWMDLEIIILSEIRQISYDITYMWKMYLKNDTNEPIYERNRLTDIENRHDYERVKIEGGINWEFEINIYTLLPRNKPT